MEGKIYITKTDRDRILELIAEEREFKTGVNRDFLKDLEHELNRALVVAPGEVPKDSITMNSKVLLKDVDTGEETVYTLVYPHEADLNENRVSVIAPIGTAILGFREGDVINWKVPGGVVRLAVEKIIYQPEAEGDYTL